MHPTQPALRALLASVLAASALAGAPARAADAPAAGPLYASAADLQAIAARAAASLKPGQPLASANALQLAPYRGNVEVRVAIAPAAVHDTEAEFFIVIEGSGVLQTGGTLVNETRPSPNEGRGTALEGAASQPVAKGDMLVVPEKVPHWFSRIDGKLVLLSLHVPRGEAASPKP